uniref:Uncharacterized protein n=1 Tax=Heterorhabditis bacteriophora TaxID=37862 RepID=A0A1I7WZX9_HETBA
MHATVGSSGNHDESSGRPFSLRPSCVILYIVARALWNVSINDRHNVC